MTNRRVAIVTPGTFAVPSGRASSVETVVVNVSRHMTHAADVYVIAKKTKRDAWRERRDGVRFVRVAGASPLRYIARVSGLIRRIAPSIVQVENRPKFAKRLKEKYPNLPVILSLHSTTFLSPRHIKPPLLRASLEAVDAIVVNSEHLRRQLLAIDPSLERKVTVNHLGVDADRFVSRWTEDERRSREAHLKSLGLAGKKIVLYVGRWIPDKGVHHLIRAMNAITAVEPDAALVLVGGARYGSNRATPYVRKLRKLALPIRPYVKFIGYVPHNRVHRWYRLADVVVVPSSDREAFGLVNLEAMACGVPVVAAASGGITEIVEHGKTGLLVSRDRLVEDIVENVCAILADPAYGRRLGEQGIARVRERFSWRHAADRLLELYDKLERNVKTGDFTETPAASP